MRLLSGQLFAYRIGKAINSDGPFSNESRLFNNVRGNIYEGTRFISSCLFSIPFWVRMHIINRVRMDQLIYNTIMSSKGFVPIIPVVNRVGIRVPQVATFSIKKRRARTRSIFGCFPVPIFPIGPQGAAIINIFAIVTFRLVNFSIGTSLYITCSINGPSCGNSPMGLIIDEIKKDRRCVIRGAVLIKNGNYGPANAPINRFRMYSNKIGRARAMSENTY